MKRILGIDPGSRITGYGVIDVEGSHNTHIGHGCIRTTQQEFSLRLGEIFSGITAIIEDYRPDEVAIEDVFVSKNASSALKLGQARGAAICAAVNLNCPVFEYTPRLVKQSVVGKGSAEKEQVQHMVKIMLNLRKPLPIDASDALGIALTHAHLHSTKLLIESNRR